MNMRKVGGFISYLRKQKDLTQVELADQLSVSHQAVSKWERGESLPDVATLPKLASLFGVRVDDVLRGEHETQPEDENMPLSSAQSVEGDDVEDRISTLESTLEQDSLPEHINQVNPQSSGDRAVAVNPNITADQSEATFLEVRDVIGLAPFVDRDVTYQLIRETNPEAWEWRQVCDVAPFVHRDVLRDLVHLVSQKASPTIRDIVGLAPFLERSVLDTLLSRVADEDWQWNHITGLAPFIGRERLGQFAEQYLQQAPSVHVVSELAPFLAREDLQRLIQEFILKRS